MASYISTHHLRLREIVSALSAVPARVIVSSVTTLLLLSACGGGDDATPAASSTTSTTATSSNSANAPKAITPQVTPATVSVDQTLTPLLPDKPYVDNTLYDASAGASLPSATEGAAVTHHRIKLNGLNMTYTATAGHLTVRDTTTNAPQATIFYTAYTLDNQDTTRRPVTVFFNGGPGSPSSFLHMGSFGPMRVFTAQGSKVSGPNDVTLGENPQTLLDKTDVIFVDPVGTGFSEAVAPSKNQDFWGVNPDVNIMAGFINRYMITNDRGSSPLMVYGESYGGPRAGILSYALQNVYGIKLSGLMMQAPALNFYEGEPARRDPLPPYLLPTITMAAKYYGKISDPTLSKLSLPDLFQASENLAFNELRTLVPQPTTSAQQTQATSLVGTMQAFTGNLPVLNGLDIYYDPSLVSNPAANMIQSGTDVLKAARSYNYGGFLSQSLVIEMFPGKTLGLYDLRKQLTGNLAATQNASSCDSSNVANFCGSYLIYDPSLNDLASYDSIFSSYAYNTLKYQTVSLYHGLSETIGYVWDHYTTYPDGSTLSFPDATTFIADEMQINPNMQVLTSAGYYDSVVPAARVDWDMQSVAKAIPAAQMQKMYTRILYPAGHMGYADDPTRQLLHDNLSTFLDKAVKTSVASMK